ncbi:MAG: phosphotransferase [Coriobacteriales bacterium]|nr:phosphotransferase [Coriobacteriales bacterium]
MDDCSASLVSATQDEVVVALAGRVTSNNAAKLEQSLGSIRVRNAQDKFVLDAGSLEYISSAGLRVMMRLAKAVQTLEIINVSVEVYDVFDMTGLTQVINVSRRPREISVEGCEVIGQGGFGTVYRLDPETIVKVYREGMPRSILDDERAIAQRAFLLGVPTAISYDVVTVGKSFGLVFELLDADTLSAIIGRNPSRLKEYGVRCARLLKEIHAIEPEEGSFPCAKQKFLDWAHGLADYLEPEEVDVIVDYVQNKVPDGNSFLHGDYHCKNIMEVGGELMLLDIGDATCGHPAIDLAQILCSQTVMPRTTRSVDEATQLLGFAPELAQQFWGVLTTTYLGTNDPDEIGRVSDMLTPLAILCLCFHATRYASGSEQMMQTIVDRLVRGQLSSVLETAVPIEL